MRRYCTASLLGFILLAATLAIAASPASAGTLQVWGCHGPYDEAAPLDRWSSSQNAPFIDNFNNCGNRTGNFGTIVQQQWHAGHTYGEWRFLAPPGTNVVRWRYDRGGSVYGWASLNIFRGPNPVYDSHTLHELCQAASGCGGLPNGTVDSIIPATSGVLFLTESCALQGGCDAASHGGLWIYRTVMTLEDTSAPATSSLSGELASAATVQGTAAATFQTQDAGTGVFRVTTVVDGATVKSEIADSNSGRCATVGPGRDFHHAVPCRLQTSADASVDTNTLREGAHTVQVVVEDAAGNQTRVINRTITVDNVPLPSGGTPSIAGDPRVGATLTAKPGTWEGASSFSYRWLRCDSQGNGCEQIASGATYAPVLADVGSTLRLRATVSNAAGEQVSSTSNPTITVAEAAPPASGSSGDDGRAPAPTAPAPAPPGAALNGVNASRFVILHAGFRGGRRSFVSDGRQRVRISGQLLNAQNGAPITGASLELRTRANIARAPERAGRPVLTRADGRFTLVLAKTAPGQRITLQYRERAGDPAAATAALQLRVRALLRWTVRSSGRILRFAGRISSPTPIRPQQYVEVQWRRGRSWATLAHPIAVRPNGRWSLNYRVGSNVRTGQRFRFRAAIRERSSHYAFEPTASRPRWVTVR